MKPFTLYVNTLIKMVRQHIAELDDLNQLPTTKPTLAEYRTIRLSVPRRIGKTTAIVELLANGKGVVAAGPRFLAMLKPLVREEDLVAIDGSSWGWAVQERKDIEVLFVEEGFMLDAESAKRVHELSQYLWEKGWVNRQKFVIVYLGTSIV